MIAKSLSFFVASLFLVVSTLAETWWKVQTSGIDTNLRAVSAAYTSDANGARVPVVSASGSNGVILKSLDEGKTWQRLHVKDGDALDFRGIVAFNASTAYLMSIGEGEKSHIYKPPMAAKPGTFNTQTLAKSFSSTPSPAAPRRNASLSAILSMANSSC